MMYRKGSNREKFLAIITAIVVVCAVVFVVIIEPQLKKRRAFLERMHQLQLKLTKMKGDLLIKDRIDNIYSQIEPLIAGSGTDQQEKSGFTRELSGLYSKLNVTITSTTILPTVDEQYYRRLSAKIEMQGHIREIFNFIIAVENHPNPIKIEQFNFKAREIIDNINASFLVTKVVAKPQT
jgi:Tfp pilus assembly protein PilO